VAPEAPAATEGAEEAALRPAPALLLAIAAAVSLRCGAPTPRSPWSFDQIRQRVAGKSARQIEALLGRPDARQRLPMNDEKWIWWNYTDLDGEQYAPEVRGRMVHLEILFDCRQGDGGRPAARAGECRAPGGTTVVSYSRPAPAN
jgi:hypothetical protein